MIYSIVVVLIALICILLILAVLLQSGDGNGLSGIANAGASTQMMGSRRTADILSKATSFLGGSFLVLCVLANLFIDKQTTTRSTIQDNLPAAEMGLDNFGAPSETPSALPAAPTEESNDSEN